MTKKKVQTRVDRDLAKRIDEYAEKKGISESEAMRRLINGGLVVKGYRRPNPSFRGVVIGKIRSLLK